MKALIAVTAALMLSASSANCQSNAVPACEWCGAAEAPKQLTSHMVIAQKGEPGERIRISGVVRDSAGRPASNVLLYAYHTNAQGRYAKRGDETGNGQRHGYLRGWLRTDAQGRYTVETIKPGAYPGRADPAHIHVTLTDGSGIEQWVAEIIFDDDPRVTQEVRRNSAGCGGDGIVRLQRSTDNVLVATHDITVPKLTEHCR